MRTTSPRSCPAEGEMGRKGDLETNRQRINNIFRIPEYEPAVSL